MTNRQDNNIMDELFRFSRRQHDLLDRFVTNHETMYTRFMNCIDRYWERNTIRNQTQENNNTNPTLRSIWNNVPNNIPNRFPRVNQSSPISFPSPPPPISFPFITKSYALAFTSSGFLSNNLISFSCGAVNG